MNWTMKEKKSLNKREEKIMEALWSQPEAVTITEIEELFADKADAPKETFDEEKERKLQEAVLNVKNRYGKNAILRGMNLEEKATARDRNRQIGGHKA